MLIRILVAADQVRLRNRLMGMLNQEGGQLVTPIGGGKALHRSTARGDFDLLVAAREALPKNPSDLIASIRAMPERPEVIVVSAREDAAERAALLTAGCMAVLYQGLSDRVFAATLASLVSRIHEEAVRRLQTERPEEKYSINDFISNSTSMQAFLKLARRVVDTDSSLLILGETGAGKERLAQAIHAEGRRSRGPFVAVNCGAIPENLIESELFGHEEGAFTGATRARRGYFELAHHGTVFLDEIGDLPLHLQVKLLRVLENHEIQRVGGEKPLKVDVRVIASTNRQLEEDVTDKRFRSDLFYRLAVVTLQLPPLRERREDIPQLVTSYIDHFRPLLKHPVRKVSPAAMKVLVNYHWPGNVRELINVIERTLLLCTNQEVTPDDLPPNLSAPPGPVARAPAAVTGREPSSPPSSPATLRRARKKAVAAFEREYLQQLLTASRGRVGEAARLAGINPRTLYELMKRHGVSKEQFKEGTELFRG